MKKLFPEGDFGEVFYGQLGFDVGGRVTVSLHVKNRPAIEVEKWGVWGVDYNVIVAELLGKTHGDVVLKNQIDFDFAKSSMIPEGGGFFIKQEGSNFSLCLPVKYLIFQGCTVYKNCFES
ncbi:hypothetical protein AVMA1855_25800 [Acidovorax sp. SUPP1855]|uniref:hypothetical protein n=1 Tax=Acidovorax sp. SUPP1855 TaxID=431774 RepID=UPI0023DE256F|nr:hypothetical protein [Acidovorax sp. SUPP1855]GKS87634.1 hypothetical protein AVMA1855_25800 [Acidovorax sp. SUPP1855]